MIMKEKLLKEFEEWLNSEVKKNTANFGCRLSRVGV